MITADVDEPVAKCGLEIDEETLSWKVNVLLANVKVPFGLGQYSVFSTSIVKVSVSSLAHIVIVSSTMFALGTLFTLTSNTLSEIVPSPQVESAPVSSISVIVNV